MRKRIGEFFVEQGILEAEQIPEILEFSRQNGLRFGDAGIALRVIDPETIERAFGLHTGVEFYHFDERYYSSASFKLLPTEWIEELKILPLELRSEWVWLGLKGSRRVLEIGCVDPTPELVAELESRLLKPGAAEKWGLPRIDAIHVYLITEKAWESVMQARRGAGAAA